MVSRINNLNAFVTRNRNGIKTVVVLGLVIASVVGMAFNVDAVALAGGGIGGTY